MNEIEKIVDSTDKKIVIIEKLIKYLDNIISSFDYDENYDQYLDIFLYISNLLREIKGDNSLRKVYTMFKEIHGKVQNLLIKKPGCVKKDSSGYLFLKYVINNIEALDISLLSNYVDKYEGDSYEFISYLMFDVRNYSLIEMAIKKYPYIVNFIDKNGIHLIDKIVDKYLESSKNYVSNYKLGDNSELLYYDKLLKYILSIEKIDYTFIMQQNNIKKVKKCLSEIDNSQYNDLTKRKLVYWYNEIFNVLNNIENETEYGELKYKYDIKDKFDYGVMSDVLILRNSLKLEDSTTLKRRIYTIDDVDAKEIDDGISITMLENGNFSLGVHIADPGRVISSNSIIMDEAHKRATSIYLSNMTIPMFHEKISKELLSLNEKFLVPVKSYYFEIDNFGNVISFKIVREKVKSYKKTSYDMVNQILQNVDMFKDDELFDDNFVNDICILNYCTSLIKKNFSFNKDYVELKRTEANASKTNITVRNNATKIVEMCMVLVNYTTAKYMSENNYPFLYRCHSLNSSFVGMLNYYKSKMGSSDLKSYINIIKEYYPDAYYSTYNRGHSGLNLEYYSHITSPLRRDADIRCNEAIDIFYFDKPMDADVYRFEEYLSDAAKYINSKCKKANMFTLEYEKECGSYVKKLGNG